MSHESHDVPNMEEYNVSEYLRELGSDQNQNSWTKDIVDITKWAEQKKKRKKKEDPENLDKDRHSAKRERR